MDYDYNVVRDPCNIDSDSEGNACEENLCLAERFVHSFGLCVSTPNSRMLAGLCWLGSADTSGILDMCSCY